jgi:hypothetical protein
MQFRRKEAFGTQLLILKALCDQQKSVTMLQ